MSQAEIMMLSLEFDGWKNRFDAIIKYSQLASPLGYKFIVEGGVCSLDPPRLLQNVTRWYYGYSRDDFLTFLRTRRPEFFDFLMRLRDSKVMDGQTMNARQLVTSVIAFAAQLSRACCTARIAYPMSDDINQELLSYYHKLSDWISGIRY